MSSSAKSGVSGAWTRLPTGRTPPFTASDRRALLAFGVWAALIAASVADWATTYLGMRAGLPEQNPAARWVIHTWGFAGFAVFKAGVIIAAFAMARVAREAVPWGALYTPAVCGLATALAAFTNALALVGVVA